MRERQVSGEPVPMLGQLQPPYLLALQLAEGDLAQQRTDEAARSRPGDLPEHLRRPCEQSGTEDAEGAQLRPAVPPHPVRIIEILNEPGAPSVVQANTERAVGDPFGN